MTDNWELSNLVALAKLPLVDREAERDVLRRFFGASNASLITLLGPSGVGKSRIITESAQEEGVMLLQHSFSSGTEISTKPLSRILEGSFAAIIRFDDRTALPIALSPKDVRINMLFLSAGFEITRNDNKGFRWFDQFSKAAIKSGISTIWLSNLELCTSEADLELVEILGKWATSKPPAENRLRVIFEVGTLENKNVDPKWRSSLGAHHHIMDVKPFNRELSERLYRAASSGQPPTNLHASTGGIPLHIEFFADARAFDEDLTWIRDEINGLGNEAADVMTAIFVLGEIVTLKDLKCALPGVNVRSALNLLALRGMIEAGPNGTLQFSHPKFAIFLNRTVLSIIERDILAEYINNCSKSGACLQELLKFAFYAERLEDWDALEECALSALPLLFETEDYRTAARIVGVLRLKVPRLAADDDFVALMVELAVLTGMNVDAQDILERFAPKELRSKPLFRLLEAQICYGINQFPRAEDLCRQVILAADATAQDWAAAFALAASSALAQDKVDDARDYAAACQNLSNENAGVLAVQGELLRLMPEFEPLSVAEARLADAAPVPPWDAGRLTIANAKHLHNWGMLKLYKSRGKAGKKEIEAAHGCLTLRRSPYITYTLSTLALFEMLDGHLPASRNMLLNALNLCFEEYDRFTILNNLGALALLDGDIEAGDAFTSEAIQIVNLPENGLTDQAFKYSAFHNLAVVRWRQGRWKDALSSLAMAKVPDGAFWRDRREKRHLYLRDLISKQSPSCPLRRPDTSPDGWIADEFLVNFVTLSFYDFNHNIIGPDNCHYLKR